MRIGPIASTAVCCAAILALYPDGARAQTTQELLEIIREQSRQIDALSRKVDQLEAATQQATEQAQQATEQAGEAVQTAAEAQSEVEFDWGPSPTLRTPDGRFEAHLRGRVLADFAYLNDEADVNDGAATQFRAARIGVEGIAWRDIGYKLEVDFADAGETDVTDGYVEYLGFDQAYLRVGQYKTPNSLAEQTSSRFITFMERPAFTDAFNLNRRLGIGGGIHGELASGNIWSFNAGAFGENFSEEEVDEGYAFAGRGTYAIALAGEDDWVHLGTSVRYRNLDDGVSDSAVRYRQRPFININSTRHVDTGVVPGVKSDYFFGGESAAVLGPLSFQSEVGYALANRSDASPNDNNIDAWGANFDVSYFLTGESRNYQPTTGEFGRIRPNNPIFEGGWGAWQLAARFDYLDLEDEDAGVSGGKQYTGVFGVNWYLNPHARLMLNYARTEVRDGPVAVNEPDGDNSVNAVGFRAQVDF